MMVRADQAALAAVVNLAGARLDGAVLTGTRLPDLTAST